MTYKTIFIDYLVISDLHFVSNIFSLWATATSAPLCLVLHRVVIRNFLQVIDIAPCAVFDTVMMYRCVYNKDDLRMLFACFHNVHTWTFPTTKVNLYWALWASTATNIKHAHNASFDIVDALSRIR